MSVEEAVRLCSPFVDCLTLDVKTYNDPRVTQQACLAALPLNICVLE
jgi:hypothetical protein